MSRYGVRILPQPDDGTCGPTCLHAIYAFYGDDLPLESVIEDIAPLPEGGTYAVNLARHALRRGYRATIYTYDLPLFDPSWFAPARGERGERRDLAAVLTAQAAVKLDPRLRLLTAAYQDFLALGGRVEHQPLGEALLDDLLRPREPVLAGVSATYLYGCARERQDAFDDVGGEPVGHFVLLSAFDATARTVAVADPLHTNPRWRSQHYDVAAEHLIGAILLGVVTFDADLLLIRPPE